MLAPISYQSERLLVSLEDESEFEMTTYLTKSEIAASEAEVRAEFERLLGHRVFASDPNAKQWQFFRHCFSVLIGDLSDHFRYKEEEIRYYKCEVARRLSWYYSELTDGRMDRRIDYFFRLEHVSKRHKFLMAGADYPSCKEYLLLVSLAAREFDRQKRQSILFRAVHDAVSAEFAAYLRLPDTDLSPLRKFFAADGPAYRRISDTVERHHRNGEIISNEGNPSQKALLNLEVVREDEQSAEVRIVEYWYLRWWSETQGRYSPRLYRRRNRRLYSLVKRGSRWLVWDNIYRRPKATLP